MMKPRQWKRNNKKRKATTILVLLSLLILVCLATFVSTTNTNINPLLLELERAVQATNNNTSLGTINLEEAILLPRNTTIPTASLVSPDATLQNPSAIKKDNGLLIPVRHNETNLLQNRNTTTPTRSNLSEAFRIPTATKIVTPKSIERRNMPCLNEDFYSDFHSSARFAVVTMNTGTDPKQQTNYLNGALVLGQSIRQHTTIAVDQIFFTLDNQTILPEVYSDLLFSSSLWRHCVVSSIPPPREPKRFPQYYHQFSKLHVWQMEQYDSIVYMDSDTYVLDTIDELFTLDDSSFAAARDFMIDPSTKRFGFIDTFNMGVFRIQPSVKQYNQWMHWIEHDSIDYEADLAEQGFLNVVLQHNWTELPMEFNANTIALRTSSNKAKVRIVHFTVPKPWMPCGARRFRAVQHMCQQWKQECQKLTQKK